MSDPTPLTADEQKEAIKRKIFAIPCDTQEALHRWILLFLGLDIPDSIVDPDSNSSPMAMIWEIYSKARANDPDYSRALFYAARACFKTLSAAILELLMVFHLNRNVAHMAAVETQSLISLGYTRGFFGKPPFRDFVEGDAKGLIVILRYINRDDGATLSKAEYDSLPEGEKLAFNEVRNFIKVVICNLKGTNGLHASYFCIDGDSRLSIESTGSNRLRKQTTARGVYRALRGDDPGGRSGGEFAEVIENPLADVKLMSLNLETGAWEFRKIVRAQRSFRATVKVLVDSGAFLICTDDEPILVEGRGFVQAGELSVGDVVAMAGKSKTNSAPLAPVAAVDRDSTACSENVGGEWHQVVLGSLLGDMGIYKKPTNNPYLQEQHCVEQARYLRWKRDIISQKLRTVDLRDPRSGYTGAAQVGFRTGNSPLLLPYIAIRTDLALIDDLGPLGLAVWYMDDGCAGRSLRISTECFTEEQNYRLKEMLRARFGIVVDVVPDRDRFFLRGDTEAKRRLVEVCAPYIHEELAYKFDVSGHKRPCDSCGKEFWFYERNAKYVLNCGSVLCRLLQQCQGRGIAKGRIASIESAGQRWVYDFTLEGNHNFVANGIIVHNCTDELDIINDMAAYQESLMIPAADRPGVKPISMLTSSRKFSFGLVQKEIDNEFDKDGDRRLHIRHWNIIDVTEACPASRHRPDLPRLPIYLDEPNLVALSEEKYNKLVPEDQRKFVKKEGYTGCLTNCKLFPSCRGLLATEQKSTSNLLREIPFTITQFKTVSVPTANAQLLCRKPSTEGLIYPHLERSIHMLTPAQIVQKITGETVRPDMTKAELIVLLKLRGVRFAAGMDFGFKHNFAVPLAAIDGARAFVIACIIAPELLPDAMIHRCNADIKSFNPSIWPDTASPQLIAMFKKAGFRMREWDKGAGSVNGGIDIVAMRLRPTIGEPLLFFLAGDPGVEALYKDLSQYHWSIDSQGNPTDSPDEDGDDGPDALRYLVMNEFPPNKRLVSAPTNDAKKAAPTPLENFQKHQANWFQNWKEQNGIVEGGPDGQSGKKGGFKWSL